MQGHYVQAWCHKYSTRQLRPSRHWLQEIVPSVRCLQQVFLRAKPKAACEALLPYPGGDVQQPQLLCKYDVIHKTGSTQHITTSSEEDRAMAIGNQHKKLVKLGRVVPEIWSRRDRHRQTHRHAHHNTPLPYRGRSNNITLTVTYTHSDATVLV